MYCEFLTGPAGCGKTYELKRRIREKRKDYHRAFDHTGYISRRLSCVVDRRIES